MMSIVDIKENYDPKGNVFGEIDLNKKDIEV